MFPISLFHNMKSIYSNPGNLRNIGTLIIDFLGNDIDTDDNADSLPLIADGNDFTVLRRRVNSTPNQRCSSCHGSVADVHNVVLTAPPLVLKQLLRGTD